MGGGGTHIPVAMFSGSESSCGLAFIIQISKQATSYVSIFQSQDSTLCCFPGALLFRTKQLIALASLLLVKLATAHLNNRSQLSLNVIRLRIIGYCTLNDSLLLGTHICLSFLRHYLEGKQLDAKGDSFSGWMEWRCYFQKFDESHALENMHEI